MIRTRTGTKNSIGAAAIALAALLALSAGGAASLAPKRARADAPPYIVPEVYAIKSAETLTVAMRKETTLEGASIVNAFPDLIKESLKQQLESGYYFLDISLFTPGGPTISFYIPDPNFTVTNIEITDVLYAGGMDAVVMYDVTFAFPEYRLNLSPSDAIRYRDEGGYSKYLMGGNGWGAYFYFPNSPKAEVVYNFPEPSPPPHYHFAGWYYDAEFQTPYDGGIIPEGTGLYAKIALNEYTITYITVLPGAGNREPQQVTALSLFSPASLPTINGNNFIGWYLDSGFVTPYDPTAQIVGDMTLYARWQLAKLELTIYIDGEPYNILTASSTTTYRSLKNRIEFQIGSDTEMYMDEGMTVKAGLDNYINVSRALYLKTLNGAGEPGGGDNGGDNGNTDNGNGNADSGNTGGGNGSGNAGNNGNGADTSDGQEEPAADYYTWIAVGGGLAAAAFVVILIFRRKP